LRHQGFESLDRKIAAGQRCLSRPSDSAGAEHLFDLLQDGFSQAAVSGDLPAEDVDDGAILACSVDLDDVVPSCFLRL
jgi:hypothetical protein